METLIPRKDENNKLTLFPKKRVASRMEVLAFEEHKVGGPTMDKWKIDPRNSASSRWNKKARDVFVRVLIANRRIHTSQEKDALKWYANHHNKTLKPAYLAIHGNDDERTRENQKKEKQRRDAARTERLKTVCYLRNDVQSLESLTLPLACQDKEEGLLGLC